MKNYKLAQGEAKFAELIWEHEPVSSTELVGLSEKKMSWKKSTTYTVLKKLCDKGLFRNENAIVSSVLTQDEYLARQSRLYIEDAFGGSLPRFISAFIGGKKLTDKQAEELMRLIEEHKEE